MSGEIQIILGPMFSGKSTELIRRIRRFTIARRKCFVIKYRNDTRYDELCMSTHDMQLWKAKSCGDHLSEVMEECGEYEIIGIDEDFCEAMVKRGKTLIIAALDGTYQRKPFGSILSLIPMSEEVTKLSAVCIFCQKDAAFTLRLTDETDDEVIGGAEKYAAACRSCYYMNSHKA